MMRFAKSRRWKASQVAFLSLVLAAFAFGTLPAKAFDLGGDDDKPAHKCPKGKAWSEKQNKCVSLKSSSLSDDDLSYAGRQLARDGHYEEAIAVLETVKRKDDPVALTYLGQPSQARRRRARHHALQGGLGHRSRECRYARISRRRLCHERTDRSRPLGARRDREALRHDLRGVRGASQGLAVGGRRIDELGRDQSHHDAAQGDRVLAIEDRASAAFRHGRELKVDRTPGHGEDLRSRWARPVVPLPHRRA
jgi:hypothetical protein